MVTPKVDNVSNQQAMGLFEQVFGKRSQPDRVTLPWWINDRAQGNILLQLGAGDPHTFRIFAAEFLTIIEQSIRPEIHEKLVGAVDQDGFLTVEALRQQGIDVIFDSRRLELRLQVPPAQRRSKTSSLATQAVQKELANAIKPSQVSGYLNLRGSQVLDWVGRKDQPAGRQPIQMGLEGAVNLNGWVLESDAQFAEGKQLQRGNIRLIHDNAKAALRYVIGDFSPPTAGYQTSPSMLGIAVARNYTLQPDRITRPINQFQFLLERKSRVEVFSNGRSLQTLTLDAGTQDLRDLPLGAGINDVQLVITDDLGQVKRLDFATTTANNLLAPGLQQFAYSLGIPSKQQAGNFSYNWQRPTLNLAYRWGVKTNLTTGAYLQANPQAQMLGWEGYWATAIGIFNWDAAVSQYHGMGNGVAVRLRHDYTKIGQNNPTQRAFGFTAEFRSQNFMSLSDSELTSSALSNSSLSSNDTWLDLNAYYNQRLFGAIDGNFNLRYQLSRSGNDSYQASMGLSKNFKSGLSLGTKVIYKQYSNGQPDTNFLVNLNWRRSSIGQSFQTASTFSNQAASEHRLNWDYYSKHQINGIKTNLGLDFGENRTNLASRLIYTGDRLNFELSHDSSFSQVSNQNPRHETQLKFASAVVFANGKWAISRPVTNSFAMILPQQSVKNQLIGINPDGKGGYAAQTKSHVAVIPDLSAYQLATLRLDAPELPIGANLGESVLKLLPTYKSGTLIKVGKETSVFLRGTLVDETEKPIVFGSGQIISHSDPTWQPMTVFTNKAGRFAMPGFAPGKYEIQLKYPQVCNVMFDLPQAATAIYTIEALKISQCRN